MKHKKLNRILLMITIICALMVSLNGCSLAVKGAETDSQDTLIGVFITEEPLDLFDTDAYSLENTVSLSKNSDDAVIDPSGYEKPLYASINRHNSPEPSDWDISFEKVNGLNFFAPVFKDTDGSFFHHTRFSDGISDSHTEITESDEGNETKLSATIYITPQTAKKSITYHLNRVYQTADGKIYVLSGSGVSTDAENREGEIMSVYDDDQTKYLEDQKVKILKTSVTVRFFVMYEPVKITLYQMDMENKVIKQEHFAPGKLPEKLNTENETSYILVETEKKAPDGSRIYTRSLYDRTEKDEDSSMETFYMQKDGIISKQYSEVIWNSPDI